MSPMDRRQFFASFVTVLAVLKLPRPFQDPDVNFSVPIDWERCEMPLPDQAIDRHPRFVFNTQTGETRAE